MARFLMLPAQGPLTATVTMLWIAIECPRCARPVPVNGVAGRVSCARCGTRIETPPGLHRCLIEPALRRAAALPAGLGAPVEVRGSFKATVVSARSLVRCALCTAPQPLEPLLRAVDRHTCAKCGAHTSLRRAPRWVRPPQSGVCVLVGEALEGWLRDPVPWYVVTMPREAAPGDATTGEHVAAFRVAERAIPAPLPFAPRDLGVVGLLTIDPTMDVEVGELEECESTAELDLAQLQAVDR